MGVSVNACALPGSTISWAGAVCFGSTTDTEGTAICEVTARRFVAAFTRELISAPSTPITASMTSAAINQRHPDCFLRLSFKDEGANISICSCVSICVILVTNLFLLFLVGYAVLP